MTYIHFPGWKKPHHQGNPSVKQTNRKRTPMSLQGLPPGRGCMGPPGHAPSCRGWPPAAAAPETAGAGPKGVGRLWEPKEMWGSFDLRELQETMDLKGVLGKNPEFQLSSREPCLPFEPLSPEPLSRFRSLCLGGLCESTSTQRSQTNPKNVCFCQNNFSIHD